MEWKNSCFEILTFIFELVYFDWKNIWSRELTFIQIEQFGFNQSSRTWLCLVNAIEWMKKYTFVLSLFAFVKLLSDLVATCFLIFDVLSIFVGMEWDTISVLYY